VTPLLNVFFVVLPFAEAVVDQVKVKTTKALTESTIPNPENADTYTRFRFSSPVYLVPGEYAVVVLSNSDTELTRELYKNFELITVEVNRSIGSRADSRKKVKEIIAIN